MNWAECKRVLDKIEWCRLPTKTHLYIFSVNITVVESETKKWNNNYKPVSLENEWDANNKIKRTSIGNWLLLLFISDDIRILFTSVFTIAQVKSLGSVGESATTEQKMTQFFLIMTILMVITKGKLLNASIK